MNRSQQNKAIKDLQELVATIQDFEEDASHVILRDHFTSGQRLHLKGELGEMEGTPPPYTSDPTGEEACWSERSEDIGKTITKMATSINQWLTMAKWIRDLSAVDVVARAQRTVPDCLACGDPCLTRVVSGFDDKCYQRFVRAGRPDRTVFINATKASRVQKEAEEADA